MGGSITSNQTDAIAASWDRCARQYKLRQDAGRPILRLQSSEVAPRLEQIIERTGGKQGFFQHLASVAGEIGHCLVVTDADGVSVRIEHSGATSGSDGWNGIALGSCWDERVAGTNGVSMALRTGHAITVRGGDHYFSTLKQFACTGVPVLDAIGGVIGAINLVSVDRGNRADYLFSQQLLAKTAHRIQRTLFEKEFNDAMLITVSRGGRDHVLSEDALVAVNETGMIIGATSTVSACLAGANAASLKGQAFEAIFNVDSNRLMNVPERMLSIPGAGLNLSVTLPGTLTSVRPAEPSTKPKPRRKPLAPGLRQLATGSHTMAAICRQAAEFLASTSLLHIEGETGTGKSALVASLLATANVEESIYSVDCATLGGGDSDREHLRLILEQARVVALMPIAEGRGANLIFDNVDEMPNSAQAELRRFLNEREEVTHYSETNTSNDNLHIISTSRNSLIQAVDCGRFRDDLYYLLAASRVSLPPLREREHPEVIAQALASQIAGRTIELSAEATQAMRTFPFLGNIRELRSTLERVLMTLEGNRITMLDLSCAMDLPSRPLCDQTAVLASPATIQTYDERSMILDALTGSRWNVSKAARMLGMGRATINRKLKTYGIERPT